LYTFTISSQWEIVSRSGYNLVCCYPITDEFFCEIARLCPKLEGLQLESCDITDTSIYAIAHSCHNLRGLNIKDCHYLSDVAINTLISRNPNIIIPGWNPVDINSESDSDANSELGISL